MELNEHLSPRAREDYSLVEQARSGSRTAFAALFSRYKDSIYYMILKMVHNRDDADDLTIESFGKAFSNLEKYTPDYAFSTWLFKIASNNTIDFIRKKRMDIISLDDDENSESQNLSNSVSSNVPDPEEQFIREQRASLMRDMMDTLNPKYRRLIQLRYFEELSYDEIAAELNLPLGTVKAQLFRAKELLYQVVRGVREKY
ncbi:MAG: sigma-70 family RNA polymerase sigma factor [Chitinophagales bacterium]|nr:sigma-70 family RNA polymerase sigma factor [Chitinophagales bacterium]HAE14165.1 RNA polymerase subunit sigma-24 [Bacteroidota bacterium]HAE34697.1 RNA polymerase subunit sigma-24 [Bacteroidota bacterium]HPE98216.1 sigma-70 family RNA polymerase sigma factor [Chitinophagales bacterium]HPR27762.1 sigma-70 family RNA polymerase sigma factor [Chitinophagales bacterium]